MGEHVAAPDFQLLFESAPGLFLVLSPDLTIAAVSNAYLAATATRRDDIIGRGIFEVFPDNPDDPSATGVHNLRSSLQRVLLHRRPDRMDRQRYDIPRPAADGGGFEERYWDPLNTPVLAASGAVAWIIHQVEDVTDRRRLENERLRLQIIVEYSHEATMSEAVDGEIIGWNAAAEKLLGYSRVEVVGRTVADLLSPGSPEEERTLRERIVSGGRPVFSEGVMIAKDGRTIAIAGTMTPIKDTAGKVVGISRSVHDISGRRQAEMELERIFTMSLDLLCISSADGYFKRASPAVTAILGWTVDEFLARPYLEAVHPDDRAATMREVERQVVEGRKVFNFENRFQHRDGSWRTLSWTSVPQPGGMMYAVARDVTDQRRIEADVIRLNANLQQRTAQLEATNKELEAFSYSVSHDLRAPLRSIDGFSRIVLEDYGPKLDDEGRRLLNVVCRQSVRMGQLIDDLLTFSRLGRQSMHAGTCDMTALVHAVFDGLDPATRAHAPRLDVTPLPIAHGDQGMLRQVWENLLSNAVKFTRHCATPVIRIHATADDRLVTYHISDNGAGFDQRYVDKLFGVFQRLHAQDEFEGTGVGLSLVQRIIQRHGGTIWAEGVVGAGATFHFTLPTSLES